MTTPLNFKLDENGLQIPTYAEFVAWMTSTKQGIYGSDVDLSSSSPDGQEMGIVCQAFADMSELLMQIYTSMDPAQAVGVVLQQRATYNGLQVKGGTYTQYNLEVVVSKAVTLYGSDQTTQDVFTYKDSVGNEYALNTTQSPSAAGTYTYAFTCTNPGNVVSSLNDINVPVTVVLGVTSVNNPTGPTYTGIDEEADVDLRTRMASSTSAKTGGFSDQLETALGNISGVTYAKVWENKTNVADSDGTPANSFWAIVDGEGAASDIATAIYSNRTGGCNMRGNISYTVTQKDGQQIVIKWDVVNKAPVYIYFKVSSIDGINPPNVPAILTNLPSLFAPGISETLDIGQIISYVKQIDKNALVGDAGLNSSQTGFFTETLTASKNKQYVVTKQNLYVVPAMLMPTTAYVSKGNSQQFTPWGGSQLGWTYSMLTNASGGSVNASGVYTAGNTSGTDVVSATDSDGNVCSSTVYVS